MTLYEILMMDMKLPIITNPNLRILVTRTDRMGDVMLSTPVFAALRKRFPAAFIAAMVLPQNRELLEGNPAINEVIIYDKRGVQKHWVQNIFFSKKLRSYHFDIAIHLHPTNRVHLLSFLAGIPVRIGYDKKWGKLLTHRFMEEKRFGKRHEAVYNFDLLQPLGITPSSELNGEFYVTEHDTAIFDAKLTTYDLRLTAPFIVINPGASCLSKLWPHERFAALADILIKQHGIHIVLIGDEETVSIASMIKKKMKNTVTDLAGKLSLKDLGVLFSRSVGLISNDTGPVHIAAAIACPVISLFGRSDPGLSPERWRPLGKKSFYIHKPHPCGVCKAHRCEHGFECLNNIHVADVLQVMTQHPAIFPFITL